MVIKTLNSFYEVHESRMRCRRLSDHASTSGEWFRYDRMSPVREGEPLRFFLAQQELGTVLQFRVITTSPVEQVYAA